MNFTGGDYVAMAAVGLAAVGFGVREWRTTVTARTKQAFDDSALRGIVDGLTARLDEVIAEIRDLESKRQKHEIDCARIQERTASAQERTAEILTRHENSISHLQAQMSHVASGAAGKIVELGPTRAREER